MHDFRFLNFKPEENMDQHIYRIMKEQHVFQLFQNGRNALSKFEKWKDKFENFLMSCGHEFNGIKYDNAVREKMVAQCWTTERYSEAMWGIYANNPDEKFLRIRSTPRILLNGLISAKPRQANELCRIGRVKYNPTFKIKTYYEDIKRQPISQKLLFQSLLVKRRSFMHEHEVRLLYCAMHDTVENNGLYWYDVDPHELVTQIMADPNRSSSKWDTERDRIQLETNFRGKIKRSKIYDAPNW